MIHSPICRWARWLVAQWLELCEAFLVGPAAQTGMLGVGALPPQKLAVTIFGGCIFLQTLQNILAQSCGLSQFQHGVNLPSSSTSKKASSLWWWWSRWLWLWWGVDFFTKTWESWLWWWWEWWWWLLLWWWAVVWEQRTEVFGEKKLLLLLLWSVDDVGGDEEDENVWFLQWRCTVVVRGWWLYKWCVLLLVNVVIIFVIVVGDVW